MFFFKLTASEVRHPNFKGRYYSQLSVHASSFLEVVVVFQLTIIDGLLIYNGGLGSNSSVAIILRKGAVQFCLNYDQKQLCRKAYELKVCYEFINHYHIKHFVLICMNTWQFHPIYHYVLNYKLHHYCHLCLWFNCL